MVSHLIYARCWLKYARKESIFNITGQEYLLSPYAKMYAQIYLGMDQGVGYILDDKCNTTQSSSGD